MSNELNIDEQIAAIDASIEDQEWLIARHEALERLKQTDDFQLVFEEGYLQHEADRVFNLLVDPRTVKPDDRDNYIGQLDTIKNFGRYVGVPGYIGTVAISYRNAKKAKDDMIAEKQKLIAGKDD